jgi:transposase
MDTEHSAITEPVRRIEVFTGAGRRRNWSGEEKARIVAESMVSEASVCSVATPWTFSAAIIRVASGRAGESRV